MNSVLLQNPSCEVGGLMHEHQSILLNAARIGQLKICLRYGFLLTRSRKT